MLSFTRLATLLPLVLALQPTLALPADQPYKVDLDRRQQAAITTSSRTARVPFASRTSSAISTSTTTTTSAATVTSSARAFGNENTVVAAARTTTRKTTTTVKTTTKKTTTTTRKLAATTAKTTVKVTTTTKAATTAAPTPTCAAPYTGAATTVKGTGALPRPTAFVKRSGQQLVLGGKSYRIAGPNIYWLCSDENASPAGAPPDKGRVREAMAIAVAMGANTIRVHTCGVSVGPNNPYNLNPSLGNYNNALWDIRDYVIYAAREYGLRVIFPLTDNYDYYHGGKYSFLNFVGASTANKGFEFYTNQAALNAYTSFIRTFLTRVNSYTGVSYANDPTILAWETGNEFGAWQHMEAWPPAAFTTAIANAIRSVDSNHIIVDGTNGFYDPKTGATPEGLKVSTIDMMTDHGYPRSVGLIQKEASLAKSAKKAFFIGEYDWTTTHGGDSLSSYLSAIESAGLGDMIWNVMGHDAQCCAFVPHNDGFSAYYPNGNTKADQVNLLAVVKHWYKVTGRAQPSRLPAVACPQPAF
ncbi:hypothetical protein JCM11251_007018 [Rhodosporidiobolus azoricus]